MHKFSEINGLNIPFPQLSEQPFSIFFDEEPRNIELNFRPRKPNIPNTYLQTREEIWQQETAKFGDRLWNGTVLTLENLIVHQDCLLLEISDCEFKDVVCDKRLSASFIREHFGPFAIFTRMVVSVLPISDTREIAIGVVGDGTILQNGMLDIIGGTLNTDEFVINNFQDIKKVACEEMKQELDLDISPTKLKFLSLNYVEGVCFFRFCVRVNKEACMQHFRANPEIEKIEWCSFDSLQLQQPFTLDVKFVLEHIHELRP